jgi:carboxylate-amine ligase
METVQHILRHGTGADRQLSVYERTNDLRAVVDYLADETMRGVRPATAAASA